jgi:hypothetical protein
MINEKASCYNKKFGHSFPYPGSDCLQCGINQDILSGKRSKEEDGVGESYFDRYLANLKTRSKTKHRTYLQERVEPYLKFINWQNDTFEDDMKLFWISVLRYAKRNEPNLIYLLDWVKKKNCLFPRQVVKLLNKK